MTGAGVGSARLAGGCPVLVERDHELRYLSEIAGVVASGSCRCVVVSGEAGAGKSRLVREFVATLPEHWVVLRDPAARADAPAVVTIEDIQLEDPSAITRLHSVIDDDAHPLLVLATYRLGAQAPGSPVSAAVARLLRSHNAVEVPVLPLSALGLEAMARAMGTEPDEEFVRDLRERTGGNAFFAEAVLQAGGSDVPWTVTESVLALLGPLDQAATECANLLAVARVDVSETDLIAMDVPPVAVRRLVDAGVAERRDDVVTLRHALVGEALVGRMPSEERRRTNARIAEALEDAADVALDAIARHWLDAGDIGRAAACALRAATASTGRRMFATAVEMYRIVLEDPPSDPFEQAVLLEQAAVVAGNVGLVDDSLRWVARAEHLYAQTEPWRAKAIWHNPGLRFLPRPAAALSDAPRDSARGLLQAASDALAAGDTADALRIAREAASAAQAAGDPWSRVEALVLAVNAGDVVWPETDAREWTAQAERERNATENAMSLSVLAGVAMSTGHLRSATDIWRRAREVARDEPESLIWAHVSSCLAGTLVMTGDLDKAESFAHDVLKTPQPLFALVADAALATLDLAHGNVESARERGNRLRAVHNWGIPAFYLVPLLTVEAQVRLAEDDAVGALETIDQVDALRREELGTHLTDRLLCEAEAARRLGDRKRLELARRRALGVARDTRGTSNHAVAQWIGGALARHDGDYDHAASQFDAAASAWCASRRLVAAEAWCDAAAVAIDASAPDRASSYIDRADRAAADSPPLRQRIGALRTQLATARPRIARELAKLTPRELDIARCLATGKTTQQIADELFVSTKTVSNALTFIFAKLGVTRRAEAVALLHKLGVTPS